jgi:uncharacterized protein (TIGR02147 family)
LGRDQVVFKEIDIFNYFDYRCYLADYYTLHKSLDDTFSHRAFLKKAGIPGSVYLKRLILRQRKLSRKYVENFIAALGLSSREARYFRIMVHYGNELLLKTRESLLKEMLSLRSQNDDYQIKDSQLKYFSKWYYPVVREIVTIVDFKDNYAELARHVIPRISPQQARGAVRYLLKCGFIIKDPKGGYSLKDKFMTTGPEVQSTIMTEFHRKNLQWCADSLASVGLKDRDVSSLTMTVSRATYDTIKKEIISFRKRLMDLARDDTPGEMVCYAGFQLMPRSREIQREGQQCQ